MVSTQKTCQCCQKALENKRKKFCDDHCKWRFNDIKKDNESHLPPSKKRNRNFFEAFAGVDYPRGGKRSGGAVAGAMSARIPVMKIAYKEVSKQNIEAHFADGKRWNVGGLKLCDGTWINQGDIHKVLGIEIQMA